MMLDSRTSPHVLKAGTVNSHRYKDVVLEDNVRLPRNAVGSDFTSSIAKPHRSHKIDDFLGKEEFSIRVGIRVLWILILLNMF